MDQLALDRIKEQLNKYEDVAIAVGKDPNLDEMGAALALFLALKNAGKQVVIASPSEPLVEISSLVGIDKVKNYFETSNSDLIVSFPYAEGEIEKVSYTLENGFLNIIVKAGENGLSFEEKDINYKRSGSGGIKTLFIVGTPRLSDLGNLFDPDALKETLVINIDNKKENQGFGDAVLVNQSASSVSEQIASVLSFLDYPIDIDMAQNLLSGIDFATDNFQNPKTTAFAFEMASDFLKKGAIRKKSQSSKPFTEDTSFFQPQQGNQPGFGKKKNPFAFPQSSGVQTQRPATHFNQSNQNNPFMQQNRGFNKPKVGQAQPFSKPQPTSSMSRSVPSAPQQTVEAKDEDIDETPPDWLTPKVYKGSTLV